MIRRNLIRLVASGACAAAIALSATHAIAGDVDCSSLSPWQGGKRYKQGDVVWRDTHGHPTSHGRMFRCKTLVCYSEMEPYNNTQEWENVGECKNEPRSRN